MFEAKNAAILINTERIIRGDMILGREIPAAFRASSSLFSPILPRVIMDASKVARGRANGNNVALPHPRNSKITQILNPFPTSSSIYSHKNCIIRINNTIRNVIRNGPKNDFIRKRSSFFIYCYLVAISISLSTAAVRPSIFLPPADA